MSIERQEQVPGRIDRLGKYELICHVASGGMSAVYKARDSHTGRIIALKVLQPDMAETPVSLSRFRREASAAARLRHPNIVAVYGIGKKSGTHYIAMEYVDGIDLHRYVFGRGMLDADETIGILIQAARALEHAHSRHIVHRDIKPSNFLLTRYEGERLVKLTDFGLALDLLRPADEGRLTRAGTTLGTVDYMAPEQTKGGRDVDIRTDLYALGCTAYFMLTGQPPFPEGAVLEKLYKHVHEEPADPRDFNPTIPDDLLTVVSRMLRKDPEERYQTPTELLRDLERIQHRRREQANRSAAVPPQTVLDLPERPTDPEVVTGDISEEIVVEEEEPPVGEPRWLPFLFAVTIGALLATIGVLIFLVLVSDRL